LALSWAEQEPTLAQNVQISAVPCTFLRPVLGEHSPPSVEAAPV
jgi:hypothetical protein